MRVRGVQLKNCVIRQPKERHRGQKILPPLQQRRTQWFFFHQSSARARTSGQSFASNNRPMAMAALHFWVRGFVGVGDNQALCKYPHREARFIFLYCDLSIYSYIRATSAPTIGSHITPLAVDTSWGLNKEGIGAPISNQPAQCGTELAPAEVSSSFWPYIVGSMHHKPLRSINCFLRRKFHKWCVNS